MLVDLARVCCNVEDLGLFLQLCVRCWVYLLACTPGEVNVRGVLQTRIA